MMMTSGGAVHYKSMFDAGSQIIAKEGTKSLFKGAGANILRGVAGAGVLSLYDKLQQILFGKVYSGGAFPSSCDYVTCVDFFYRIWLIVLIVLDAFFCIFIHSLDSFTSILYYSSIFLAIFLIVRVICLSSRVGKYTIDLECIMLCELRVI